MSRGRALLVLLVSLPFAAMRAQAPSPSETAAVLETAFVPKVGVSVLPPNRVPCWEGTYRYRGQIISTFLIPFDSVVPGDWTPFPCAGVPSATQGETAAGLLIIGGLTDEYSVVIVPPEEFDSCLFLSRLRSLVAYFQGVEDRVRSAGPPVMMPAFVQLN